MSVLWRSRIYAYQPLGICFKLVAFYLLVIKGLNEHTRISVLLLLLFRAHRNNVHKLIQVFALVSPKLFLIVFKFLVIQLHQ